MKQIHIAGLFIAFLNFSCSNNDEKINEDEKLKYTEDKTVVVTAKAKRGAFYLELENNGKLEAKRKAVLQYRLYDIIVSVNVKNGQFVKKGMELTSLENDNQQYNYERACRGVEKSRLNLEDALLNTGYLLLDSAKIPKNIMNVALIRSGYKDAIMEKKLALKNLEDTRILAPFDGTVADLKAKPYNNSIEYKNFCTLIDDSEFEVTFPILETEVAAICEGLTVKIIPFAFEIDTFAGVLSEINPRVNEYGMISVKALVKNKNKKLQDGMNVKVIVQRKIDDKIFIPKEAITLRQEQKVVFVNKNDTAIWRYVGISATNSKFSLIEWGIKENEEVIIDGNVNLAHLAPIEVMKKVE